MLKGLWARLTGNDSTAGERADEEQQMSPAERRFTQQSVEDRRAGLEVQGHLGGSDPGRLLDDR